MKNKMLKFLAINFLILCSTFRIARALECGKPAIKPITADNNRIINGFKAIPHSWPWMISLGFTGKTDEMQHACGGALISSRFVLTAAHCVEEASIYESVGKPSKGGLEVLARVYVGVANSETDKTASNTYRVKRIIRHSGYNPQASSLPHDIALLELTTSVKTSKYVSFLCLNKFTELAVNQNVFAAGWGRADQIKDVYPNDLMQVRLNILPYSECRSRWGTYASRQICAGLLGTNSTVLKDTCTGDSGGPLVYRDNSDRWYVAGIVSFGNANCDGLGVYTKVKAYYSWIKYYAKI